MKYLIDVRETKNGTQYLYWFPNDYGAAVINNDVRVFKWEITDWDYEYKNVDVKSLLKDISQYKPLKTDVLT